MSPSGATACSGSAALELVTFGARALPSRELLRLVLRRADQAALTQAERALDLVGAAREAALLDLPNGPRLAAALELGRRAWMLPSPRGRRVHGPVDVAVAVGPRAQADETWLVGLDARLTLCRLVVCAQEPGALLRAALQAGAARLIVCVRRPLPAVPTTTDCDRATALATLATACSVPLLDWLVLGDDGLCSLLRLGLLPAADRRYS